MATPEQVERALERTPPGTRVRLVMQDGSEVPATVGEETEVSLEDGSAAAADEITDVLVPASSADPE